MCQSGDVGNEVGGGGWRLKRWDKLLQAFECLDVDSYHEAAYNETSRMKWCEEKVQAWHGKINERVY